MKSQSNDPRGGDMGDGHSPFAQGGYDIARWAAGGTIAAVSSVVTNKVTNAYSLVRPPGHHATPSSGMGFCMFSNIPIAIKHARENHDLGRVVVVDWDVHHGNGTEASFLEDPNVLTISIHQDGNFPPDTGKVTDRGEGNGFGSSINIPLPPGSGNGAYQYAMDKVVLPAIRKFRPELIIVASGFDSSNNDPLGRMLLTSGSYAEMTKKLMDVSNEVCNGKLVINHEGGYSPTYVPFCGLAVLETLSGHKSGIQDPYEEIWAGIPGQELNSTQSKLVDNVSECLHQVPSPDLVD